MKTYRDFPKICIGDSDIASLVVRDTSGVRELRFGGDNCYYAYECFGEIEIGGHYHKVFDLTAWVKIYDDQGLVYDFYKKQGFEKCSIYRAGDYGCIIHWHN